MKKHITNNLYTLTNEKTGERVDGVLQLAAEKKARLYQGYFISAHQDRHLIKALSPNAYRLSAYLRSIMTKGNWITVTQGRLQQELTGSTASIKRWIVELKRLDVIRGNHGTYMYNPRIAINGGSRILKQASYDYHSILWVAKGLTGDT